MRDRILAARPAISATAEIDFFETKIRPVFAANCYGCHTKAAMGALRLDSREGAMKGGKS